MSDNYCIRVNQGQGVGEITGPDHTLDLEAARSSFISSLGEGVEVVVSKNSVLLDFGEACEDLGFVQNIAERIHGLRLTAHHLQDFINSD